MVRGPLHLARHVLRDIFQQSVHGWLGSIFAATLGIAVLATESWGQSAAEDQPRQEESATNADNDSNAQNGQPVNITTSLKNIKAAIRDLIAEEDQIDANAQQNREKRDLEAQEGMARWAEWMFYATAATVALTLAALFAIIRTLHHTRRAADYTKDMLVEANRSAAAAEDAVAATRDVGEKQVRAYLHVKSVAFVISGDGIGAKLLLANAGQSPAIGCAAIIKIEIDGKTTVNLKMPLPNVAANSETLRTIEPHGRKNDLALVGKRYTAFVKVVAKDVFDNEIGATSMRTVYIPNGPKSGQFYELEDAEGFFPDDAVRFLAEGHGRGGPADPDQNR